MITSLHNKSYKERLASLNLELSLAKCCLLSKLLECFKILKGFTYVDANKLFSIYNSSRTKNNYEKLKCRQVQLGSNNIIFTNDVVRE